VKQCYKGQEHEGDADQRETTEYRVRVHGMPPTCVPIGEGRRAGRALMPEGYSHSSGRQVTSVTNLGRAERRFVADSSGKLIPWNSVLEKFARGAFERRHSPRERS